jgi:hypothetical protein
MGAPMHFNLKKMEKRIAESAKFWLWILTVNLGCSLKTVHLTNDTLHWDDGCANYELQLNPDSSFCQKIEICDIAMPTICCGRYEYIADTLLLLNEANIFLQKNTLISTTECETGKLIFKVEGYPYTDNSEYSFINSTYLKIMAQKNGMGVDTIQPDEYPTRKNGKIDIAVKFEKVKGYDYIWLDDGYYFKGFKVQIVKDAGCMEIKYPLIQRDLKKNQEHCSHFYAMKPRIIKKLF